MLLYKSGAVYATRSWSEGLKCVKTIKQFSFTKYTTYGLGGMADICYMPENIRQAVAVYKYLEQSNAKFITLGNGSNVLASDKRYHAAVVCTRRLKGIARINSTTICCLAGTTVAEILKYCLIHKLSGLEYLYGIPATIGGITYMNGGAGGCYVNSSIKAVKVFNGKITNLSNQSCNFGYKHSTMQDIKCAILCVFLSVKPDLPQIIVDNIEYFKARRQHLPKGKSCGCVFKNPGGVSAGKLIEDAQLKGMRIGGAFVSPQHANFIINDGGASNDVAQLINLVKRTVLEKSGIRLEEEVVYIGEFNDFDS